MSYITHIPYDNYITYKPYDEYITYKPYYYGHEIFREIYPSLYSYNDNIKNKKTFSDKSVQTEQTEYDNMNSTQTGDLDPVKTEEKETDSTTNDDVNPVKTEEKETDSTTNDDVNQVQIQQNDQVSTTDTTDTNIKKQLRFKELESKYNALCEELDMICDFNSEKETELKKEYLKLKDELI